MKKILILLMVLLAMGLYAGTDYTLESIGTTMPNLMFIDNTGNTGISGTLKEVVDGNGDAIGLSISTARIQFGTGYILEWRTGNLFIYDHSSTGLTIDADTELFLLGTAEIDLTSTTLIDINAASITIDGAIATTGALTHVGTATFSSTVDITGDLDSDGITNLDVTDIDGATQIDATLTVGISGVADDVIFHSDTATEEFTWDATNSKLIIDGLDGQNALEITDGDVAITDDLTVNDITCNAITSSGGRYTGGVDLNGNDLLLDVDADTRILTDTDDQIDFYLGDLVTAKYQMTLSGIFPVTNNTFACGTIGNMWSEMVAEYGRFDKFIATGSVAGSSINNVPIGASTENTGKFTTLEATQGVIFNDAQADYDFRVESANYDHTLFIEGSSDNVGIGDATPDVKLHIHDTDTGANIQVLKIERTSGSPVADDETQIGFFYTDDNTDQEEFARITLVAQDIGNGSEDGELLFSVANGGVMTDIVTIGNTGMLIQGILTVDSINGVDSTDGTDDYTANLSPAINSYPKFLPVWMIVTTANTGPCTLALNGMAAKNIKTVSGADPTDNDILATGIAHLVYDGTNFVLINPATTCD